MEGDYQEEDADAGSVLLSDESYLSCGQPLAGSPGMDPFVSLGGRGHSAGLCLCRRSPPLWSAGPLDFGVATSWALWRCFSLSAICAAATWFLGTTCTRFHRLDMAASPSCREQVLGTPQQEWTQWPKRGTSGTPASCLLVSAPLVHMSRVGTQDYLRVSGLCEKTQFYSCSFRASREKDCFIRDVVICSQELIRMFLSWTQSLFKRLILFHSFRVWNCF